MSLNWKRTCRLILAACMALQSNLALANPNSRTLDRGLSAHATVAEAGSLVSGMYSTFAKIKKSNQSMHARRQNPASFSDDELISNQGQIWLALRQAKRLQLMGEPAGYDLERAFNLRLNSNSHWGWSFRGTPRGSQVKQKLTKELNKRRPQREKKLDQIQRSMQRGQFDSAEKQLEGMGVELHGQMVFYSPKERERYIQRLDRLLAECTSRLQSTRKKSYFDQAQQAIAEQRKAISTLQSEGRRIVQEIGSEGKATIDGDAVDAFAAFDHVSDLWGAASAAVIRMGAIRWALTQKAEVQVDPSPVQVQEMATSLLASIIDSAASATPPEKVGETYSRFLKQISVVDRRAKGDPVSQACASGMGRLAAKDPNFAATVSAYERATREPLRWRLMLANKQAKAYRDNTSAAETLLQKEVQFESRKHRVAPNVFTAEASEMIKDASSFLIGKQVVLKNALRLSPTSRTAVVPFRNFQYGNVPVPPSTKEHVDDLKVALLIDDSHGPYSAEAANAISSAELHDYVSIAGQVRMVTLESPVTRFIAMPDIAYTLVPLGTLPPLATDRNLLEETCWRLDILPNWVQHKYFTVNYAPTND